MAGASSEDGGEAADTLAVHGPTILVEIGSYPGLDWSDDDSSAGRTPVSRTEGYARSNGRCTEPDAVPKDLHVPALRRDHRRRETHPGREPQRGRAPRDRDPGRP